MIRTGLALLLLALAAPVQAETWSTTQSAAVVKDTYINGSLATTNYDGFTTINVRYSSSGPERVLLDWTETVADNVPAGATITNVTLSMFVGFDDMNDIAPPDSISVWALTQSWVEAEATHNVYSSGNNWPGGAGALGDADSLFVMDGQGDPPNLAAGAVTIDSDDFPPLLTVVQDWHSGARTQYGILMKDVNEGAYAIMRFTSDADGTTSEYAQLTVTYTPASSPKGSGVFGGEGGFGGER